MDVILRTAGAAIVGACLAVLVRKHSPELAVLLAMGVCAFIFAELARPLGAVADCVRMLAEFSGLPEEIFSPVFRCLGLTIAGKLAAGAAKDAGEGSIASLVELAVTVCCLYVTLPLVRRTVDMVGEML